MTDEQLQGMISRSNGESLDKNPFGSKSGIQSAEWEKGWKLLDDRIARHIADAGSMLKGIQETRKRAVAPVGYMGGR